MKKSKKTSVIVAIIVFIVVSIFIVGTICVSWLLNDWTIRYKSELNEFFGEGNWEVISDESDYSKSRVTTYSTIGDNYSGRKKMGFYRTWSILCENEDEEEEIWQISNRVYNTNNVRYGLFSNKRLRAKNGLTFELMEISFLIIEEEILKEFVDDGLTEEEVDCISVDVSYHDGNPPRSFYDKLAKESWFTREEASAENYLATDLYDFCLHVRVYDYKMEKLSEEEKENLINGLKNAEKRFLRKYEGDASFEIICEEYDVKYVDGELQ